MPLRRVIACVAVTVAALVASAQPASASPWHHVSGQFQGQGTRGARTPALAVSPSGQAVLAWVSHSGQVRVAFSDGGGRFGRGRTVAKEHRGLGPRVAINAAGDAVIAWLASDRSAAFCCDVVQAAVRPAGGRLGPPQTLSLRGDYAYQFDVDVARDGTAGVSFYGGGFANAAFAARDGRFGAPLNASHYESADGVQLCFDRSGRANVGWSSSEPGPHLAVAERAPGGAFGRSWVTAGSEDPQQKWVYFSDWQLGCAPTEPLAVWSPSDGAGGDELVVARRRRGEPFRHLTTLDPDVGNERLATAPNGRVLIAWVGAGSTPTPGVRVARRGRSGDFAVRGRTLPGSFVGKYSMEGPDAAIDNAGRSIVAWTADEQTYAALGSRTGDYRPAVALGSGWALPPTVAVGGGLALVAWGSGDRLEVAVARRP